MARRVFGEFDGIDVLRSHLGRAPSETVRIGIGDDAAVLWRPKRDLVVSVDASFENVHFDLAWMTLQQAAERSFHTAVSDLAAMAAAPLAAVCGLELPQPADRRAFAAIGKGQAKAALALGCPIVGGNVTSGTRYGFTTTVLGTLRSKPALRAGAQPGDEVWLSDEVGWAGLGLHLFQQGLVSRTGRGVKVRAGLGKWVARAVQAFTRPRAKLRESQVWCSRVNALIDTSDSLASEARHLALASDVLLVLEAERLRETHTALYLAAAELALDPLELILFGGEDYALLATGSVKKRPRDAIVVGQVCEGRGAVLSSSGKCHALRAGGFDHLRHKAGAKRSA